LLTACRDNLVRLQNVSDGALAFPPAEHEEEVFDARLTPDGKWIASVSLDRTLRISSRRTGQLVMPPIELGGGGWCAEITPDGRYVVAAGGGKSLVIVDLAELGVNRPFVADAAIRIGEVLSGNSVDQDRIVSLNSDEWLARFHEARPAVAAVYPLSSEPAMPFAMPDTPVRLLVVAWIDRRVKPHFAAAAKWIEDELSRNRKL
jgi:hypothetical protein